jgi:hypothetical protein
MPRGLPHSGTQLVALSANIAATPVRLVQLGQRNDRRGSKRVARLDGRTGAYPRRQHRQQSVGELRSDSLASAGARGLRRGHAKEQHLELVAKILPIFQGHRRKWHWFLFGLSIKAVFLHHSLSSGR